MDLVSPTAEERARYDRALAAAVEAYAPYSGFRVGSVLLDDRGQLAHGVNLENNAYSAVCAERNACAAARADGMRRIVHVAVASPDATGSVSPCGSCRQVLLEHAAPSCRVTFLWENEVISCQLIDLLPLAFTYSPESASTSAAAE